MKLVNVSRPILPADQFELRSHMTEMNRLGDLGIKWRRLGEVGVTLLDRGEYLRAVEVEGSELAHAEPEDVAGELNGTIAQTRLAAKIYDIKFLGNNRFLSISYMLDSETLKAERTQLIDALDQKNGKNGFWREFDPHLTIATIERYGASEKVLEAFYDISPESVTLLPPVAKSL